ncbi:PAX3- and PAX7-binding protein 1 [Planococcus citri]|uniref:PAX3- and PAX7-binding protein 1 n=1 Tax=Planococcus citri TaxID=170843 RepID=UPI0031F83736
MSLFKKPNRNIRRREIEVQDDEVDTKETEIIKSKTKSGGSQNGDPASKSIKQTLLSFGQEFDEGDDGEVFKIKRSYQSKKIRKQIDREKEEKRRKDSPKTETSEDGKAGRKRDKIITTDDQVTIKIKNPIAGPVVVQERILSGLSAEMADYKSDSGDEDEKDSNLTHHKFSQPDHVKMLLKSGRIPDAALIHAARKRRQQAREMGGANYISIEDENAKLESESKSRLVREDDNDGSDEEERITMSGIVSVAADREKRKEGLDTYIASDGEDETVEDDEWENQQIRKAVTGAQLAAAQQESYYYQYMNNAAAAVASTIPGMPISLNPQITGATGILSPESAMSNVGVPPNSTAFASFLTEGSAESADPEIIAKKLRERLENLEEMYKRRENDIDNINHEIITLQSDFEKRKINVPELAERFQFYQDLRGYVTDLVECLDEKIPVINSLEQRLITMYQKQTNELVSRRRLDVKDQMEDLTPTKNLIGVKKDEEKIRRTAEREGRRIRRLKSRNIGTIGSHIEGMSSDDEITEMAATTYRNQKEIIESDARRVFDDVVEEFVSINDILKRFSGWRKLDKTAYVEAYANLCLPKVLGPIIRMNMLMWNPLNKEEQDSLENLYWMNSILLYSAEKTDTEESLRKDPDLQLLPNLIDKIVVSKLEQIVKAQWDPLSTKETQQLVAVVRSIIDYPFIAPKSKLFTQLMNTIIDKMKQAVENDVFIPMFPKQLLDSGKLNVFFQKQFASSVKLFGNLLKWHEIINETILIDIANCSLLNRYLLMAIRTLQPLEAAAKCHTVASLFPRTWLKEKSEAESQLTQFFSFVKLLITQIDGTNPHGREAIEKLAEIIRYV